MGDDFTVGILGRKYEIEELLDEGKTSLVFVAHDRALDRQVAIAVLKTEYTLLPDAIEAFVARVGRIAKLDHHHILRIYDLGTVTVNDVQRLYLVTQLVRGSTLTERLGTGILECDETERILKDVCAALDYAHSQEVFHLDLKPDYILFDEQDTVMVSDFGLTKMILEMTCSKAGIGVPGPAHLSPEQLAGGQVGSFSDVYALGIVLHQMLTGELPKVELMGTSLAIRPSESLPSAIQSVIRRATHSDPAQRYHKAGQLAEAFTVALHPLPDHIVALREALHKLGQLSEDGTDLDNEQVATCALARARLFSALGYGEPGKEEFLERQQDSIVLGLSGERPLAFITFMCPGSSPAEMEQGLVQLKEQHTANESPDTSVLCDGRVLWLYHHAETGFDSHPTLRLSLKDITDAEARAVYGSLGRDRIKLPPRVTPSDRHPIHRRAWGRLVAGGLILLAVIFVVFRFVVWAPPARVSLQATTPSPLPTLTPSSAAPKSSVTPSFTPSATPSPTPSSLPYVAVRNEHVSIYTGPGESYDVLGQVQKGDRLIILGRSGDGRWCLVDYLGWHGWIAAQSVVADFDDPWALPTVETPPPPVNRLPVIAEVSIVSTTIEAWDVLSVTCRASDPDGDELTYAWDASDGFITGEGEAVTYSAPEITGTQTITVVVRDEDGRETTQSILVQIIPARPCISELAGIFDQIWREYPEVRRKLGCATGEGGATSGAQQFFDRGVMFWRKDIDEIYVLWEDNEWEGYRDTWADGMDEYSCASANVPRVTPPTPVRGFGMVWCEQLDGPNADIGWATYDEQSYDAHWQRCEGGLMWQGLNGAIHVLYNDKTWQSYPFPTNGSSSSRPSTPPQQIRVGDKVRVCTAHDRLALRPRPQLDSSEMTHLDPGESVIVVDGPAYSDGWPWWLVRTDDGIVGWVAEGGDEVDPYFICPEG